MSLARSYRYCEQLARREGGNFHHAFRLLPRAQRLAMCALYAFLRLTDDLGDGPGSPAAKRAWLLDWQTRLERALQGQYTHPLHPALHRTLTTYAIPPEYLRAVLAGVTSDLEPVAYATFGELERYCHQVAGVVGLACIRIWGCRAPQADQVAVQAGLAFQLTNILRDLKEDAAAGRIYLPREDLDRFGYPPELLLRSACNDRFRELMRFQIARARSYYRNSWPLLNFLPPPGRAVFWVMARTYQSLLDAIEKQEHDVFRKRVRVSYWRKLGFLIRSLPLRLGPFF